MEIPSGEAKRPSSLIKPRMIFDHTLKDGRVKEPVPDGTGSFFLPS